MMNIRQVLCLALVAMTLAPAFGGLLKAAVVPEAIDALQSLAVSKLPNHDASAEAVVANPSAPAPASEPTSLLYVPTVDVDIKKVPIVTVSDAPCKNICKNVCKLDFTKKCETVPVEHKVCSPSKKSLIKKVCSKKCTLTVETPKIIKGITVDEPDNPNPSTPPTAAAAAASATVGAQLPSLDIHKDIAISASADSVSVDADLSVSASSGRRLSGLIAAKAAAAAEVLKSIPVPACDEVCQDVQFEVPEIECKMETREVESCKNIPTKNCEQKCVCLPQKDIDINLPNKVLDVSFSKQAEESADAASVAVSASAAVDVHA